MTTIKFNKFNVTNGTDTARVFYHLDNQADGRRCVTLCAKDYDRALGRIIPSEYKNDTDSQIDYFETGRVRLYEDNPLYPAARMRAELAAKDQQARADSYDAKLAVRRAMYA